MKEVKKQLRECKCEKGNSLFIYLGNSLNKEKKCWKMEDTERKDNIYKIGISEKKKRTE